MKNEVMYYNCRFFSPGAYGCASNMTAVKLGAFKEWGDGICRRHTPRQGNRVKRANAEEYVCLAEWPQVMTNDWCGEFEPRHTDGNTKECACANCTKGEKNRE